MKRVAPLFSKKFLRNAAIVLALGFVAYIVMYGVREGFQAKTSVFYLRDADVSSAGYTIPTQHFKGMGPLKGINIYVWGPCMTPKSTRTDWVQVNNPKEKDFGPRYTQLYLTGPQAISLEDNKGKVIRPADLSRGVTADGFIIKRMQGAANLKLDGKCPKGDANNNNATIKVELVF